MATNFNLTFGTDPEYFIVETIDGKDFSVPIPHFIENLGVPEIGFDESRKHPVIFKCDDYKIMMDGVAAEANPSPCKSALEMHGKIQSVLANLGEFAGRFGYKVSTAPTVYYDFFKWYREGVKTLEWCGVFGCDPDQDAILSDYNSPEIDVATHPYRYGGGHLHISDGNEMIHKYPVPFIRILAMTVGNFSIANSSMPVEEKLRMFKYGQPGRFRVQHYPDGNIGVEYRSPSNLWTTDLDSIEGVMYWANRAYELLNDQDRAISNLNEFLNMSIEAIREVDQDKASFVLQSLK